MTTYRTLLVAVAASGTVFGLLFTLVPDVVVAMFGRRLDPLGSSLVRQLGGAILGLALMNWFLRNITDGQVRRAVVVGDVAAFVVIAAVAVYAAATGLVNVLGWAVPGSTRSWRSGSS